MNETMYMATRDTLAILDTKRYSHQKINILGTDVSKMFHHLISQKILHITHRNISQTLNKFQLSTYHLTVPTHESNYVYGRERNAKHLRYKEIFT